MKKNGALSASCFCLLLILVFFAHSPVLAKNHWRIVGGSEAPKASWPSAAAILYKGYDPSDGQFCGGNLIDSRWVVTAAHCMNGKKASGIEVLLGQEDLEGTGGERIGVDTIIVHPDYDNLTTDFDLALLRLASASSQTTTPVIARGDPQNLSVVGTTASIAGWGGTSEGGQSSDVLMQAEVQIQSLVEAEQGYSLAGFLITDNMLPAGVRGGGVDACQGDSGGPLYVRDASSTGWVLAGVTSFGEGCARPNLPGLYTRLSVFSDWIANATNSSLAPSITIAYPVDGATDVPVNTALFVQYSAEMDADTITNATFTLTDSLGSEVPGTVRYDGDNRLAVFTPASDMAASARYTANLTTGAANVIGTAMAANHRFSFTTGLGSDTTGPSIVSVSPASGATGVSEFAKGSFVFDEYLDPFSINASSLGLSSGYYYVGLDVLSRTAVIHPVLKMAYLGDYTITAGAAIRDLCGNSLGANRTSTFTIQASPNDLPAQLDYVIPSNGTNNRTVATVVTATFKQAMDSTSLTRDAFYLENALGKVAGTVTYDSNTYVATFTPTSNLDYATIYTATLTGGVKTSNGAGLGSPVIWNFTTANAGGTDANSTTSSVVAAAKGTGNIEVNLGTADARLYGVNALSDTDTSLNTSGKPSDYTFPAGLVAYQISVPVTSPGSSATITLKFPGVTNGTRIYKVDSSGFSLFSGGTVAGGDTVTMTVTDGGAGDADGIINGVINDPVGLAAASGSTPTPTPTPSGGGGGGGGGGGCVLRPDSGMGVEAALAVLLPLAVAVGRRLIRRFRS